MSLFWSSSKECSAELTKAINVNPSVAKYYVSRSRVKFLTEDVEGAQEDIIAAILINPLEDGCIEVLPRLFADTTLTEVLCSPLTKYVKESLSHRGVRLAIAWYIYTYMHRSSFSFSVCFEQNKSNYTSILLSDFCAKWIPRRNEEVGRESTCQRNVFGRFSFPIHFSKNTGVA